MATRTRRTSGFLTQPISGRRLTPVVAAIVLVAAMALAVLLAHYWAASAPYPYTM